MRTYLWKRNKLKTIVLFIFVCLKTIGTVGVATILSMQIDAISDAISTGNIDSLINCGIICVCYAILLGVIIFLSERMKAAYMKHVLVNVRQDVFHGIMNKSVSDYCSKNSAEYITLMNQNIGTLEESYIKNIFAVFESGISIIAAVCFLMLINPIIAVISIITMAIPSLLPKLYGKKLAVLQSGIMQNAAVYTAKIKDAFQGYEVLKTYRCEQHTEENHRNSAREFENSKKQMSDAMGQLYGVTNMASITVQFLIMLLSGLFAVKGIITIGNIIAVTQLTGQVIAPAFQLSTILSQIKASKPICAQIQEVSKEKETMNNLLEMKNTLLVENLSYSYDKVPVLHQVNYTFERGKKYAIVGKSGSGKSTFLKLLAGYYENYSGQMFVDGNANKQCECALIHQNVFLFDDTIRNNITLYDTYLESEINAAVHAAGLDTVISSLPDGIDSQVEENGARFSGGEKQRIAIARAILHKKTVFLVDEATSSLDNENAKIVENSILSMKDVTCITVTHRVDSESLQKYDEVLRMENGTLIKEAGARYF